MVLRPGNMWDILLKMFKNNLKVEKGDKLLRILKRNYFHLCRRILFLWGAAHNAWHKFAARNANQRACQQVRLIVRGFHTVYQTCLYKNNHLCLLWNNYLRDTNQRGWQQREDINSLCQLVLKEEKTKFWM